MERFKGVVATSERPRGAETRFADTLRAARTPATTLLRRNILG